MTSVIDVMNNLGKVWDGSTSPQKSLMTGLKAIDDFVGLGLDPGRTWVLAGPRAHELAAMIAANVAREGEGVVVWGASPELGGRLQGSPVRLIERESFTPDDIDSDPRAVRLCIIDGVAKLRMSPVPHECGEAGEDLDSDYEPDPVRDALLEYWHTPHRAAVTTILIDTLDDFDEERPERAWLTHDLEGASRVALAVYGKTHLEAFILKNNEGPDRVSINLEAGSQPPALSAA